MALKNDYIDYSAPNGQTFKVTENGDGTVKIEDVTDWGQTGYVEGDKISAKDINAIATLVNKNDDQIQTLKESMNKKIYGFRRMRSNSNYKTRCDYIDDAVGNTKVTIDLVNQTQNMGSFKEVIEDFCRPVMLKFDGTVDYELNHDNTTYKLDGSTASDISNIDYEGNAMVEFKNYRYVSRQNILGYDHVRFATYKVDDTFNDDAFVNDNGMHTDVFYYGMFEGTLDSSNRLRSIADQEIMVSKNASTEMTYAKNNGSGYSTIAWSQLNYIWDFLTLLGATDGFQETYGQGVCSVSAKVATGLTKAKGCFFGQSGGASSVRTLWIENLWGNVWERCAGLINDNGTFKVKLTGPYPTPSDSASTYSEYINTGLSTPAEGYVKEANCSEWGFLPTATGGSASTYFCDYFYKNDSGVKYVLVGGAWNHGSPCGRAVAVSYAASHASTYIGSRLMKI